MKKVLLRNYSLKNGFTLTEILIAVVIVGVIAGLVLPKVIENYQIKTMDSNFKREVQTIEDSINGLAVSENKADFFSTMMYVDALPEETSDEVYENNAVQYMKKYLRVSQMCENRKIVLQKNIINMKQERKEKNTNLIIKEHVQSLKTVLVYV